MSRKVLVVVVGWLLLVAFSTGSPAHIIEIPVPELVHAYDRYSPAEHVDFDLGGPVDVVNGLSLRLVGEVFPGVQEYEGVEYPWCAEFIGSILDQGPGFWMAGLNSEGPFDETIPFNDLLGATWDWLLDGAGTLTFEFVPCGWFPETILITWPTGIISEAILIFDVDFVTGIPTQDELPEGWITMSRIKSLY